MNKIQKRDRKEARIQDEIENKLRLLGWFVKSTHGSIYQHGLPDVYAAHTKYGQRWIEIKNPDGFKFTASQRETFPLMAAAGVGIWIATAVEQVPDILHKAPNWYMYMYLGVKT